MRRIVCVGVSLKRRTLFFRQSRTKAIMRKETETEREV